MKTDARIVRGVRRHNGWTQADLAQHMHPFAGWTASTVSWLETDRRRLTAEDMIWLCYVGHVSFLELHFLANLEADRDAGEP